MQMFKRVLIGQDRLLPALASSNIVDVSNGVNSVNSMVEQRSPEFYFQQLRKSSLTVEELIDALSVLKETNVAHSSIPADIIQAIDQHIVRLKPNPNNSLNILKYLKYLQLNKEDFSTTTRSILLEGCCQEIKSSPKFILTAISCLNDWYNINDMSVDMHNSIDKALSKHLPTLTSLNVESITKLSYLKFTWTMFSDSTKSELLRLLNTSLMFALTDKSLKRLLFCLILMGITYEDLQSISSTLLNAVGKKLSHSDNIIEYFKYLADLKFPFSVMSPNFRMKMEEACIESLKRGQNGDEYTLHSLIYMKVKSSDLSPRFTAFVNNELANHLSMLSAEQLSRQLKLLGDINIKWNMFSKEGQELLLSTLTKQLPLMTDENKYFTLQGLILLQPNYDEFPDTIQQFIMLDISKNLQKASPNRICSLLVSLGKMKLGRSQLSNEAMDTLLTRLTSILPTLDNIGTSLALHGLAGMKMTPEDFPEELRSIIATWLQNNKIEQYLGKVEEKIWKPFSYSFKS